MSSIYCFDSCFLYFIIWLVAQFEKKCSSCLAFVASSSARQASWAPDLSRNSDSSRSLADRLVNVQQDEFRLISVYDDNLDYICHEPTTIFRFRRFGKSVQQVGSDRDTYCA